MVQLKSQAREISNFHSLVSTFDPMKAGLGLSLNSGDFANGLRLLMMNSTLRLYINEVKDPLSCFFCLFFLTIEMFTVRIRQ